MRWYVCFGRVGGILTAAYKLALSSRVPQALPASILLDLAEVTFGIAIHSLLTTNVPSPLSQCVGIPVMLLTLW